MNPITYPARPVNGGNLERARPKSGEWLYEPKLNGWRALVHGPTGEMWNRKGEPLSIASSFEIAIRKLRTYSEATAIEWWDCEVLDRRHDIAKGCIIVLDWIPASSTFHPPWKSRKQIIHQHFGSGFCGSVLNQCLSCPQTWSADFALKAWMEMQGINRDLGCDLYEGLVAKRTDSPYPIQLTSPDREFPFWVKHRFI